MLLQRSRGSGFVNRKGLATPDNRAIVIRYPSLAVGEGWFVEEPPTEHVHLRRWRMHAEPSDGRMRWTPFDTLTLDLKQSQADLMQGLNATTRYEIRRSQTKDGLIADRWGDPSASVIEEFEAFCSEVPSALQGTKRRPQVLRSYASAGRLCLTRARQPDGTTLVWHAYFVQGTVALLLRSCSGFRTAGDPEMRRLYGRANPWLHWRDISEFQDGGITEYDWGGYYIGENDAALERVNAFKRRFGGELTRRWEGQRGATTRGKAYVLLRTPYRLRVRRAAAEPRDDASNG